LGCEIMVSVRDIIKGHWIMRGWFHNMAKKYPNKKAYLYIVKLSYENERFYKVGVTTNSSRKRYGGYGNYKVIEEVKWIEDSCLNISKLEKFILRKCKLKYNPIYSFDGKTEIIDFDKLDKLEI